MSNYGPQITVAKLYERQSKRGSTYMLGRMGMVNVVLVQSDEVSDSRQRIWHLKISEPLPKFDARDVARSETRTDPKVLEAAARGFERDPLEDPIPF